MYRLVGPRGLLMLVKAWSVVVFVSRYFTVKRVSVDQTGGVTELSLFTTCFRACLRATR